MIYGISASESIRNFLLSSQFLFYLTGSRYFGTATDKSDWDYFVTDSPEVRSHLEMAGFRKEADAAYHGDPHLIVLYKKGDHHIQCVANAKGKEHIQYRMKELLKIIDPIKTVSKDQMRSLWRFCLKLYEDGTEGSRHGVDSIRFAKLPSEKDHMPESEAISLQGLYSRK